MTGAAELAGLKDAVELLAKVVAMDTVELADQDLPEETLVSLAELFHTIEQGAVKHQRERGRVRLARKNDLSMTFHDEEYGLRLFGSTFLRMDQAAMMDLQDLCAAMLPNRFPRTRKPSLFNPPEMGPGEVARRDGEFSLGHVAYDAHFNSLGVSRDPFESIGAKRQRAWNDAVEAVYQRVKAMADPDYDETPRDGIPMIDMPPRIGVDFHNGEQPASVYKLPPPDKLASEQGIVIYIRSDLAEPDVDEDGYEAPSGAGVRDPEHKSAQEAINRRHSELLRKVADLPAKVRMGDLVRLREPTDKDRAGPMMVQSIHPENAEQLERAVCGWFRENGQYQDECYPTRALEHVTFVERLA